VVVLIAPALWLYAVRLGDAPIYLHDAEVQFALHAASIAQTAHDANGRFLPLYFQMPDIGGCRPRSLPPATSSSRTFSASGSSNDERMAFSPPL
jgi:hypothetical protein